MTKAVRPYTRVYWEAIDDPKFAEVWDDDHRLAGWLRLLVAADMAWPASASLQMGLRKGVLDALVKCGLIDLDHGHRYRVHGLDKERGVRSEAAREAINARWHGNPAGLPPYPGDDTDEIGAYPDGNTQGIPSQAEPSKAKIDTPSPSRMGLRSNGTNPRAVAAMKAQRRRDAVAAIHMRYLRHEISEDEERRLVAEVAP